MIFLSIDQSFSHCALVLWDQSKVIDRMIIRTGLHSSKTKTKDVLYFSNLLEQIEYISDTINEYCKIHNVENIVMEAISLSSIGNRTRDLAGLFYCVQYSLLKNGYTSNNLFSISPNTVKAFARELLPEHEQTEESEVKNKKTGKKTKRTKKKVMKKPDMIKACEISEPGWLEGLTLTAGKGDYADAYFIGKVFLWQKETK